MPDPRINGDERLNGSLRPVVIRAVEEAKRRGSSTVEAEHLLLSLADPSSSIAKELEALNLGYAQIVAALEEERARSLAVAGIAPDLAAQFSATPREGRPGWGASAREAFNRNGRAGGRSTAGRGSSRGDRRPHRLDEADLLIGILRADLGTVPRALAFAGIDRRELLERIRRL